MRNLTISDSINLKGSKEFNHLRITNFDKFFATYQCNLDYYATPFSIIADLENQIKFANNPEEVIFCSYKPEGQAMFRRVDLREEGNLRIVEYEFDTTIS